MRGRIQRLARYIETLYLRTLGMGRVLIIAVGILLAVGLGALLSARDGSRAAERRGGDCREWFAAKAYRREIASARKLVPRMRHAFAAPGLSIAIAADGKLVWSESCGYADRRRGRKVTRATQFRVGSVSKTLTAATVARLSELGLIDFDAPIREYVAAYPRSGAVPTVRQLGGHLGGIRHYEGVEAINTKHYSSVTDSLRVFIDDPLVAPPGEQFHYSSYGFNLLGAAVETAASSRFGPAVTAAVLRPLGMRRTSVGRAPTGGTRFYEVTGNRRAVAAPYIDLSDRYPSGGFLSTAEDLVRLGLGVADPTFLGDRSRALLFTSQRTQAGEPTGYGLGFEVGESPVGPVAGHTGNVVGGTAGLLIHPRARVVVALVTNIGFVTAPRPPDLTGTPGAPQVALPFIRHVLRACSVRARTSPRFPGSRRTRAPCS
jgi:serine beta-lactamase-like protein LACTB